MTVVMTACTCDGETIELTCVPSGMLGVAHLGACAEPPCPSDQTLSADYRFYWEGGMRAYYDSVDLLAPRRFKLTRHSGDPASPTTCETELSCCCRALVSVDEVKDALDHPDVVRALSAGQILYGVDTTPSDGALFVLERGTSKVKVGEPCRGHRGCREIPAGVQAMVNMLSWLYSQEVISAGCVRARQI